MREYTITVREINNGWILRFDDDNGDSNSEESFIAYPANIGTAVQNLLKAALERPANE